MTHPLDPSSSTAGPQTPVAAVPVVLALDDAALGKLRDLDPDGRAGIVRRVLQTFEGSLVKLMAQFAASRKAGDDAGLRHVAHTLRSSAASIGALELAQRCQEVEAQLRAGLDGRSPEMTPNLDALALESTRAAAAVRAMLDRA